TALFDAKIDRLGALAHAVGLNVESHLLAVHQGAHARPLDGRNMDKHILGAVVRRYEAKSLGGVEEFYGAGLGHGRTPSPVQSVVLAAWRGRQVPVVASAIVRCARQNPPPKNGGRQIFTVSGKGSRKRSSLRVVNARTSALSHK